MLEWYEMNIVMSWLITPHPIKYSTARTTHADTHLPQLQIITIISHYAICYTNDWPHHHNARDTAHSFSTALTRAIGISRPYH